MLFNPKAVFFLAFLCTLIAKLWLAYVVPITGDEALFFWWGRYPYWGYYDHPPMVGWMIALLSLIGESPLALRILTVSATFFVSLGILDLVNRLAPHKVNAKWNAATLYLLTPISWIGVPVTNDTPLILFVFLSFYCFARGELLRSVSSKTMGRTFPQEFWWFVLTGLMLGLAFLSKYLAVVIAFAYAVTLLRTPKLGGPSLAHGLKILVTIFIAASPFVLLNVAYNATNCWNNVMFNAINRHDDVSVGLKNLGIFIVMMIYLVAPWTLWGLWKSRKHIHLHFAVFVLVCVSFGCFLLLSLFRSVGLHWVLAFLPLLFVLTGVLLSEDRLRRYIGWTALWCMPHVVLVVGFFGFPGFWLEHTKLKGAGFVYDAKELPAMVMLGASDTTTLMAEGYSPASILGYHAKRYVPVFGVGSRYARQDDYQVDFQQFDGKPVRILLSSERPLADFLPFFDSVSLHTLQVRNRQYWVIHGEKFKFSAYRETVIAEIAKRYYQIPALLPMYSCPFTERYDLMVEGRARSTY
ncbi:glycosyltransferase family 39 protein [beta proteobacterium MWH-UniP1]